MLKAQDAADEALQIQNNQQSALPDIPDFIQQAIAYLLDSFIPPVLADVTIADAAPQINFQDTSPSNCGGFLQPACPSQFQSETNTTQFFLQEGTSSTFFNYNGAIDISLLGGDFYFDTSPIQMGDWNLSAITRA